MVFADNVTNETVNITTNVTTTYSVTNLTGVTSTYTLPPIPEEFYGSVKYFNGDPVLSGSIITAKNQNGNLIGNFTMTENGTYGDSYKSAPRLIARAESTDDIITFYVNDVKSTKTMKFDSAGIKRADITVSMNARPTIVSTPEPTPTPTEEPVVITTTVPTPTVVPTTTIQTTVPTTIPTTVSSQVNDPIPKFAGVLLLAVAICIIGSVITYFILTKKMKREDDEEIIL